MLKKVAIAGVAVAALAVAASLWSRRPAQQQKAERSVSVAAPPAVVLALISDLRRWPEWSPRERLDPGVQRTYGGPPSGLGSSYYWTGDDRMGEGRLTVTDLTPSMVGVELELKKPRPADSDLEFHLAEEGSGTRLSLAVVGQSDLEGRPLGFFTSAEKAMGAELSIALAGIKELAEKQARLEAARVERSAVIAAPPSAVAAQLSDARRWSAWSPWAGEDSKLDIRCGGAASGAGSTCYWQGADAKGRVTIIANTPSRVDAELETEKPGSSLSDLVFTIAAEGAGTRVTLGVTGGTAGGDVEKALARLTAAVQSAAAQASGIPAHD
ncbi:MAG TPA: SRPBCC family protein [Myxococcales bacterium]|nr:SRPBCC family protein [Myxococcales bacterium]